MRSHVSGVSCRRHAGAHPTLLTVERAPRVHDGTQMKDDASVTEHAVRVTRERGANEGSLDLSTSDTPLFRLLGCYARSRVDLQVRLHLKLSWSKLQEI